MRIEAISWPVCQTPPRIVTHQVAVLKPNRIRSHVRSASDATPRRPDRRQSSPSPAVARIALTTGSHAIAWATPTSATSGASTNAGNGANGTKTFSPITTTS